MAEIGVKNINQDEENENRWMFQIFGPDTVDGTVRISVIDVVLAEGDTPADWLAANQAAAQTAIDAGRNAGLFGVRQEIKNFLADNPQARQIIQLGPDNLEGVIESRTEAQETLLLKALSFGLRLLAALIQEDRL